MRTLFGILLASVCLAFGGPCAMVCADGPAPIELRTGERYFRVDGRPAFVIGA